MSVEKFILTKDPIPFTTIPNKVLQNLPNAEALGVWCYLQSLPQSWKFHKQNLREHFNIGRDKFDRILSILEDFDLIEIILFRDSQGRFAQCNLHVKSGENIRKTNKNKVITEKQPSTEKPLTDSQVPDNDHYKRNNNKLNKKQINISCASDDARDEKFISLSKIYPRKENMAVAHKMWKKKKLYSIADQIISAVENRLRMDWLNKEKQYIPLLSTYLNNKRWTDEIVETSNEKQSKSNAHSKAVDLLGAHRRKPEQERNYNGEYTNLS